jgi:site-specific recombinase XerD
MTLEDAVAEFLAHKRALARKYHSEEAELRPLVRFAAARGAVRLEDLTPALLDESLISRARMQPRSFNHLLGVTRCLLDWAVSQQLLPSTPLHARSRRTTAARVPFLLEPGQVRQLLHAARALRDGIRSPGRGVTYHAIFALCYGLGLRGGEARALRAGDIDRSRDLLIVTGGKFGKTRLVPARPADRRADRPPHRASCPGRAAH